MSNPITDADIERTRIGYRKIRGGDPTAFDDWDLDAEIHVPKAFHGGGDLRGVHELLEFTAAVAEHWEEAYPEPEEFMAVGDKLIVLGTWRARARRTGRTVAAPFAHVFEMTDGKIVYFRNYLDTSEVLESLEEPLE